MNEMSNILDDEKLTNNKKINQFNEKLNDYAIFAEKVVNINETTPVKHVEIEPVENMFNAIPKTFQNNANALMSELKKHPNIIQWNPINHEVSIKGKPLKGSNIIDLIGHVMRSRKTTKAPVHGDTFLKILAGLNMPEEFVKNKYQIAKFRAYKHGDDDNEVSFRQRQVVKARKQLAAGAKRFDGTKRYTSPIKKFKWHPI